MSEPFVAQLRTRGNAIQIAEEGAATITVRVQMAELWDTVKAVVSPSTPVRELKVRALEELYPVGEPADSFVLKLRGWEVLDENATVADAGARNGSIFLLTYRRRRAVR